MRVNLAITACTLLLGGIASAGSTGSTGEPAEDAARNVTETYFAFDSSLLDPASAAKLAAAADELRQNPDARILVAGFADPIGASDYNLGLSIRRTEAVREALEGIGVNPDRMVFAFYGEDGPRRESHALDRHVSIQLTREPLHAIIGRTLPQATALLWNKPVTAAELTAPPIPVATR